MDATRGNPKDRQASFRVRSKFFAPPPEFDGCFTTFYHLSLEVDHGATVSDHLQPEWGNIRFFAGSLPSAQVGDSHLAGSRFTASGPSSKPAYFEIGSAQMWGIGFLPLGWARFVGRNAEDYCNRACNGEREEAFRKFARLTGPLCEEDAGKQAQYEAIAQAMRELMQPTRDDETILRVHKIMVDPAVTSVATFSERSELSVRSLERLCRRYFGFAPKLLLRRQRFMRSLATFMLDPSGNWTDAMDDHYHDQAQFTREFRDFMGMSPTAYAALDHPILASFVEARARMWGSAAQTLDKPG